MGADFYPQQHALNRSGVAFCRGIAGVSVPDAKEAILGRSGIIWTIVGVLLIIALLIYIF
jgi:hypothetical protein